MIPWVLLILEGRHWKSNISKYQIFQTFGVWISNIELPLPGKWNISKYQIFEKVISENQIYLNTKYLEYWFLSLLTRSASGRMKSIDFTPTSEGDEKASQSEVFKIKHFGTQSGCFPACSLSIQWGSTVAPAIQIEIFDFQRSIFQIFDI